MLQKDVMVTAAGMTGSHQSGGRLSDKVTYLQSWKQELTCTKELPCQGDKESRRYELLKQEAVSQNYLYQHCNGFHN